MRVWPSGVVASANSARSAEALTWFGLSCVHVAPLSVERQTPLLYAVA